MSHRTTVERAHLEAPLKSVTAFSEHALQLDAAVSLLYVPNAHVSHESVSSDANRPGVHEKHGCENAPLTWPA
jgi:hypothetical protein